MRLDFKSLAFGYNIKSGAATPAWETALGQGKVYKINNKTTINELVKGLIYKAVSPKNISFKKGKGGATVNGDDEKSGLVISAVFDKVYINDTEIEDGKFILLVMKDDAESHRGRLKLKYGPDNKYQDGAITVKNSDFIALVRNKFGLSEDACWFVTDISVEDQDVLILKTTIINSNSSEEYDDNNALHAAWDKYYDEADESEDGKDAAKKGSVLTGVKSGDNIILYGVPGCGKSRFIRDNYLKSATIDQQERIVFHPDYSYSDFVGQILPTTTTDAAGDKHISYPFVPGPFTRILKSAQDDTKNYYLIIEEINRGNAPAIFGDIFQLLDRKSAEDVVDLGGNVGESSYTINNKEIAFEVYGDETHPVSIPSNLFILATMNTADQNVFTLDTAFKRRWRMRSIMNDISKCFFAGEEICVTGISWGSFVDKINSIIISQSKNNIGNEDKRVGAFFVQKPDLVDEDIFSEKVLMYLWNDAFKYNREDVFKPEYESLEQLIEGFKKKKFDIFKIEFEKMTTPLSSGSVKPATDYYLKANKPVAQALFEKLITKLETTISPLYVDCASGLFYIRIRTDGTKKISLADVSFKDDALAIQTEKPITPALAIGTDYTGGANRNHKYDIECKEANLDQVAEIICEACSTLKKV